MQQIHTTAQHAQVSTKSRQRHHFHSVEMKMFTEQRQLLPQLSFKILNDNDGLWLHLSAAAQTECDGKKDFIKNI